MVADKRRDWYYIDALCIDQSNEAEKPGQVQAMGEIYRRAEEVVAWIVYEPENFEEGSDEATYDPVDGLDVISSMSRAEIMRAVVENSYWSRLWIVQEVLLAKRLSIRFGSAEVEWLNFVPKKSSLVAHADHLGVPVPNVGLLVSSLDKYFRSNDADEASSVCAVPTPLRTGRRL
jgi:hypothetical protein